MSNSLRRVRFTKEALRNLAEIRSYSRINWGDAVAARYLDEINRCVGLLEQGQVRLESWPGLIEPLQVFRVQKHLFVCDCQGIAVVVLMIAHTSRDVAVLANSIYPNLAAEVAELHRQLDP